eukprot:jgi/Bigna1/74055/fgenesh1_pg.27_\
MPIDDDGPPTGAFERYKPGSQRKRLIQAARNEDRRFRVNVSAAADASTTKSPVGRRTISSSSKKKKKKLAAKTTKSSPQQIRRVVENKSEFQKVIVIDDNEDDNNGYNKNDTQEEDEDEYEYEEVYEYVAVDEDGNEIEVIDPSEAEGRQAISQGGVDVLIRNLPEDINRKDMFKDLFYDKDVLKLSMDPDAPDVVELTFATEEDAEAVISEWHGRKYKGNKLLLTKMVVEGNDKKHNNNNNNNNNRKRKNGTSSYTASSSSSSSRVMTMPASNRSSEKTTKRSPKIQRTMKNNKRRKSSNGNALVDDSKEEERSVQFNFSNIDGYDERELGIEQPKFSISFNDKSVLEAMMSGNNNNNTVGKGGRKRPLKIKKNNGEMITVGKRKISIKKKKAVTRRGAPRSISIKKGKAKKTSIKIKKKEGGTKTRGGSGRFMSHSFTIRN